MDWGFLVVHSILLAFITMRHFVLGGVGVNNVVSPSGTKPFENTPPREVS
jgi:hypothetical protein